MALFVRHLHDSSSTAPSLGYISEALFIIKHVLVPHVGRIIGVACTLIQFSMVV